MPIQLRLGAEVRGFDTIVFDCDGVLLDSMAAKIRAFREWVTATDPSHTERFMKHVMRNFGRSRTTQVLWFFENCLGRSPGEAELSDAVARFTGICEPLCATAGWREGSLPFVRACVDAGVRRYVLSGTPQQPLVEMLHAHDATGLFDRIIGSPPAKPESLAAILRETATPPERALFIGDAQADGEAAAANGVPFVYFPSEASRPTLVPAAEVKSLLDLLLR